MRGDFQLDGWLVRPSLNRIEGPKGAIGVTPRAMAVLVRLAEGRGEVVTKQKLLDDVWGNAAVTEDVLTQSVVELRKAFGDKATNARVIETIRRVGFRMLLPVLPAGETVGASKIVQAQRSDSPARRLGNIRFAIIMTGAAVLAASFFLTVPDTSRRAIDSLAVLPFVNLSDDPDLEYFSDGLSEELLNRIANLTALKVSARTSAFAFKGLNKDVREIGGKLGVDSVLEGSVRRSNDRIRITAQLIDVADGYHIWSQTFDRQSTDVFGIQDDIAQSITDALHLELSADERARLTRRPPASLDAYEYYMLGEFHFRERLNRARPGDWLERSRDYYRRALDIDPEFAPAHVGIAKTWLPLLWSLRADSFEESMDNAQRSVDRAMHLDPALAEAYRVLAWIRSNRFDHTGVIRAANEALALNPNDVEAMRYLARSEESQGRFASAVEIYRRQLELDPLNVDLVGGAARALARLGRRDEALGHLERLSVSGREGVGTWPSIAMWYGEFDEAVRLLCVRADGLFDAARCAQAWSALGEERLAEAWMDYARKHHSYYLIIPMPDVLVRLGKLSELAAAAREALESHAMVRDKTLSPAHYQILTVAGMSQTLTGDYAGAKRYLEWRLDHEHVDLRARPDDYISLQTFLAYACSGLGDSDCSEEATTRALVVAENARRQGIDGFPELTIAIARLHALRGQRDAAIAMLERAVAEGWRDYYAESRLPMWQSVEADPVFQEQMTFVLADLEAMRERVRESGWDVLPGGSN